MATDVDQRRQFETVVDVVYEPLQRYLGRRAAAADLGQTPASLMVSRTGAAAFLPDFKSLTRYSAELAASTAEGV